MRYLSIILTCAIVMIGAMAAAGGQAMPASTHHHAATTQIDCLDDHCANPAPHATAQADCNECASTQECCPAGLCLSAVLAQGQWVNRLHGTVLLIGGHPPQGTALHSPRNPDRPPNV